MAEIVLKGFLHKYAWTDMKLVSTDLSSGETLESERGCQIFNQFFPLLQYVSFLELALIARFAELENKGGKNEG